MFASSSFDSFLKTSAFNRSCLHSLSRRDVENTTAETPIKNVDASESFCQFSLFENLGLLISLLSFGEASELEIRHFFYSLKSHSFFSCRGDSERERVKKSTARIGKSVRQRAHIGGVLSEGFIEEREREREVQRDISRGGELERSDVFPRATRKERRSGTETFRRENERRDHGED